MSVEIIGHADELPSLASEWNALAEPSRTPLLCYEWFNACANASSPPARLSIVLVRSHGEVRAIAPLVSVRRSGVPTLEFLGNPFCQLCEPSGFLYKDEQSLRGLVDAVLSLRKPLRLDRVRADSLEATLLSKVDRGVTSNSPRISRSAFVLVATSWSQFEAGISKSRRTNLRRKRKLAEKLGNVEFEIASPNPRNFLTYMGQFFDVESSGWKARKGTSITSNAYQQRFWTLYGEAAARLGLLRVFSMRIDGEIAAARLAVEYAGRLWELKIAYDERFRRCAPGLLLTHETIRYVFERGLEAHEFLGEDEGWERIWADSSHEYLSFRIYPLSVGGLLVLGTDASRFVFRRGHVLLFDNR